MTLPFALWNTSFSIDFEMPYLHPSSFSKMKLESFFALQPLQHDSIMIKREYKSFCRLLFIRNHSLVFQVQPLTSREDVERDLSIDFLMKIAVVQPRASVPDTVSGGRYGCLNHMSVSQSSQVKPQECPAKSLQQLQPCSPGEHRVHGKWLTSPCHPVYMDTQAASGHLPKSWPITPIDNASIHIQMEIFAPPHHHTFSHAYVTS